MYVFCAISKGNCESNEWQCQGGGLQLITERAFWRLALPHGGTSLLQSSERLVLNGNQWKLNACWSLTLRKDSLHCALNWAGGSHVTFDFPQFHPNDSMILLSPEHRRRSGLMATRLKPAAVQVAWPFIAGTF